MNMTSESAADVGITIISVALNSIDHLTGCLESVANQGIPLQHVIVDGGSTDGTIDLLRSWTRHPLEWTSGPDRGISHAFNQGISRARSDIIGLLNTDDRYEPGALQRGLAALQTYPEAGFCFGHCLHIERDGREWLNLADPNYQRHLRYYMPNVNHPTMLIRRSAYVRVGGYDERWRMAMDYDWLIRAERAGVRGVLVDATQTCMAMGGISDRRWRRSFAEARSIAIMHGAHPLAAWADFSMRIVKGSARRTLVRLGLRGLERRVRLARQQRILKRHPEH